MTPSLVITIDTEPDDQWAPPGPDGRLPPFSFANTRGLGRLKDFLHGLGVPATWMTSYAVAGDGESARLLRQAADEGDEVAGHLHGWETPPYTAVDRFSRPFLYEYAAGERLAKHRSLLRVHEDAFDARPESYRAGRWGLDALEYQHLAELGYRIDSSIPPGIDFRDRAGLHELGPDFRRHLDGVARPYRAGPLWEVPASITTIGAWSHGRYALRLARYAAKRYGEDTGPRLLSRFLAATGLQRRVWVRPLKHPRRHLARATTLLLRRGAPIVNVMFHSSEAFLDTSPLSRTPEDVERLYGDLRAIVTAARAGGATPRTLRGAVDALTPRDQPS